MKYQYRGQECKVILTQGDLSWISNLDGEGNQLVQRVEVKEVLTFKEIKPGQKFRYFDNVYIKLGASTVTGNYKSPIARITDYQICNWGDYDSSMNVPVQLVEDK